MQRPGMQAQRLALSLNLRLHKARHSSLLLAQRDRILLRAVLERLDGVGGRDVDGGATEVDGADDGRVFKGVLCEC